MRVALPTDGEGGKDATLGAHFGRVPTFTIYDTETEEIDAIQNNSKHRGGRGNPPELLDEQDIDVLVCSNLGRKAVSLFEDMGIDVYSGARGTVEEAIQAWKDGKLEETSVSDACDEGNHYP